MKFPIAPQTVKVSSWSEKDRRNVTQDKIFNEIEFQDGGELTHGIIRQAGLYNISPVSLGNDKIIAVVKAMSLYSGVPTEVFDNLGKTQFNEIMGYFTIGFLE